MTTRAVTLKDLTSEIREAEVRALAELPAELSVEFDKVFEAAGISAPPHGWNADRLRRALDTESAQGRDRQRTQQELLGRLASEKVPVEDLVRDVIARDQALDAYEAFARKKMAARDAARERRAAEIESQVAALDLERRRLEDEGRVDAGRFAAWLARKRAAERDLAAAIGYLVDRPVVTIDEG
jgi:hypothetical protein